MTKKAPRASRQGGYRNVVRLKPKCRRTSAPNATAEILAFPDRLGIEVPEFNQANPKHLRAWAAAYEIGFVLFAAEHPPGHPLRAWYDNRRAGA